MRSTEKLEMLLSLSLVVGFIASLSGFSPLTQESAAESLKGMPVMQAYNIKEESEYQSHADYELDAFETCTIVKGNSIEECQ